MTWHRATLAAVLLIAGCTDQKVLHPYPGATQVRLFVETEASGGKPIYTRPQGLLLTPRQRAAFEAMLHIHKAPDEFAACFIPHHFFRYYDKTGKQVGEFAVCFCCSGVEGTGNPGFVVGPSQELTADFDGLESFVNTLGERTDEQCY